LPRTGGPASRWLPDSTSYQASAEDEVLLGSRLRKKGSSSRNTARTLRPGDLIYSGTPARVGPVRPGDRLVEERRADKAGMQARGVTQKAYVEQCRAGDAAPSAAAPEPKPTVAAPAPASAPSRPASTATETAPAPAPQRSAPTTTAAPTQSPVQQPSAPRSTATLEAGQFADEASAKARCPADTVVWVNLPSKIYHFAGTRSYRTTKRGAYMCEKEAIAAEDRASKTESHP
jgi:hypothetical protein